MSRTSVIGLFCEDIREEKSGQDTIVGILPDNLDIELPGSTVPARILPKLCIYIRINLDPTLDPGPISTRMLLPNGDEVNFGGFDPTFVKKAREDAVALGAPIVGLISKAVIGNFPTKTAGRIRLIVTIGSEEFLCANLNANFIGRPATASEQQSAQSPAAAPASKH